MQTKAWPAWAWAQAINFLKSITPTVGGRPWAVQKEVERQGRVGM